MNTSINIFAPAKTSSIITEQACEAANTCDTDQLSFKAYFTAWLASTAILAPFTSKTLFPLLQNSAKAAGSQCSGPNNACGYKWTAAAYDGNIGIGQQMSALGVIQSALVAVPGTDNSARVPVTNSTGGTSLGDSNAGGGKGKGGRGGESGKMDVAVTQGERAGAGFATVVVLLSLLGGMGFMVLEK